MPAIEADLAPEPIFEDETWASRGDLDGKTVLVTGGDSGIGRAVAVLFAKEGADVAISYLEEHQDAETTASRIRELGKRCLLIPGDISDPGHAAALADKVHEYFGGLHVLVNNASVQYVHDDFAEAPLDELRRELESNILATLVLTQACLKFMESGSNIITSTSVTAFRGSSRLVAYSATKGALLAFTRALSQQLLERGIRVNAVAPGPVWTPLIAGSYPAEDVATFGQQTPMARAGQPYEIAPSYLFLACDKYSSFISGQVLHPNGGEVVNA
jgi:NAD(P)-dependent dehydrogenase (short-subunit alcohol dehydrogenase family)